MSKRNFYIALITIHIVYFLSSIFYFNIHFGDYHEYLHQAENIKEHGDWYAKEYKEPFNPSYFTRRPPLYAAFILLGKTIVGSDYTISFLQTLLSFINIIGIVKLLRKFNLKTNYYLIIIALLILYPSQLIYANVIMSEMLFQTFVFWSIYYFLKFLSSHSYSSLIFNNLFIAAAAFTKPVFYLFWILNMIFILIIIFRKKLSFKFLLPALIPIFAINILSYVNYNRTGYYHFSSLPHDNIFDWTATPILDLAYGEKGQIMIDNYINHFDTVSSLQNKFDEKWSVAKEIILDNKWIFLKHQAKGFLIFFFDPGRYDLANFFGFGKSASFQETNIREGSGGLLNKFLSLNPFLISLLSIVLIINILFVVSFISFMFNRKIDIYFRMYITCAIFYIAVLSANIAALRYKIPLVQLFIFTVVLFLDNFISKYKQKKLNA